MSNHLALITKTTSLIAAGDIVGAESALAELADTEGDNALMVVLDQLEPKDILAVMREYDDSKASVVNLLVTPEQFARAMVLEKQYKDLTHTHLRNMVNAVVFRDDADPVEFLNAIGNLEGGAEALANYFAEKWSRLEAFARTGTFDATEDYGPTLSDDELLASGYVQPRVELDEVADGDWMQMPGCCATNAVTCSLKPCWCCGPRRGPLIWGWTTPKSLRKKTTASLRPARPTAARPHPRPACLMKNLPFERACEPSHA